MTVRYLVFVQSCQKNTSHYVYFPNDHEGCVPHVDAQSWIHSNAAQGRVLSMLENVIKCAPSDNLLTVTHTEITLLFPLAHAALLW